jgi:Mor family transcriptional regulator
MYKSLKFSELHSLGLVPWKAFRNNKIRLDAQKYRENRKNVSLNETAFDIGLKYNLSDFRVLRIMREGKGYTIEELNQMSFDELKEKGFIDTTKIRDYEIYNEYLEKKKQGMKYHYSVIELSRKHNMSINTIIRAIGVGNNLKGQMEKLWNSKK